jgi:hypothetical protein
MAQTRLVILLFLSLVALAIALGDDYKPFDITWDDRAGSSPDHLTMLVAGLLLGQPKD